MNRRLPGDPVGLEVHLRPSLPVGRKEANGQMSCSEVRSNGIVRVVGMKIQTMPNFWTGFRWLWPQPLFRLLRWPVPLPESRSLPHYGSNGFLGRGGSRFLLAVDVGGPSEESVGVTVREAGELAHAVLRFRAEGVIGAD